MTTECHQAVATCKPIGVQKLSKLCTGAKQNTVGGSLVKQPHHCCVVQCLGLSWVVDQQLHNQLRHQLGQGSLLSSCFRPLCEIK